MRLVANNAIVSGDCFSSSRLSSTQLQLELFIVLLTQSQEGIFFVWLGGSGFQIDINDWDPLAFALIRLDLIRYKSKGTSPTSSRLSSHMYPFYQFPNSFLR
jgi:hypothetical protein